MEDSIRVAIRMRPAIRSESEPLWSSDGFCTISRSVNESYTFDHVFDQDCPTSAVYETAVSSIVDSAMQGYNGTVFAYGATASGKTHTCFGNREHPGIFIQAINEIFAIIAKSMDREYMLRLSCMEIYNEKLLDLFANSNNPQEPKIREKNGATYVDGLVEEMVSTADGIISKMFTAQEKRHIAQTNANEMSSRAHTILRLIIESRRGGSTDSIDNVSLLNIVDLAGSENVGRAGAEGDRFVEGVSINNSLSHLARVIQQLSDNQKQGKPGGHVSFRNSKLTRILQTSLGGNAKTLIICTVAPYALETTTSTLKFASRAKTIKNKPIMNVVREETILSQYRSQIASLEKELKEKGEQRNLQMENADLQKEKEKLEETVRQLQNCILTATVVSPQLTKQQLKTRRQTWCPGAAAKLKSASLGQFESCSPAVSVDATFTVQPGELRDKRLSNVDEANEDEPFTSSVSDAMFVASKTTAVRTPSVLIKPIETIREESSGDSELQAENAELKSELAELKRLLAEAKVVLEDKFDKEMRHLLEENSQLKLDKKRLQATVDRLIDDVPPTSDASSQTSEPAANVDEDDNAVFVDISTRSVEHIPPIIETLPGSPGYEEKLAKMSEERDRLEGTIADYQRQLAAKESEWACSQEQRIELDQRCRMAEEQAGRLVLTENLLSECRQRLSEKELEVQKSFLRSEELALELTTAKARLEELEMAQFEAQNAAGDELNNRDQFLRLKEEELAIANERLETVRTEHAAALHQLHLEKDRLEEALRSAEERSKANENEYAASTDRILMEQQKLEVALNVTKKVNAQLKNLIEHQMTDIKRELDRCKDQTQRAREYLCSLLENCKIQVDRLVEVARQDQINAVSAATQRIEIEKTKLDEALTDAVTADEETRQLRSRYTSLEQQYLALRERAGQLEIVCDQADAAECELLDCNRKVNGQLNALKRGSMGMETVPVEELEQLKQELANLQLRANHDRSEAARNGIALAQKTHEAILREKELTAELNDLQRALAEKEEKLRRLKEELRKYSAPECPFAGAQTSRPKPPAVWDALPKRNTRAKSTGDALSIVPSNETPLKGRGAVGDENMAPSPEVNNSSKASSGKKNQSASLSCKQQ